MDWLCGKQRTKTLLKEYQDKDRTGRILDHRFGEDDPSMTPEERMLERFTRERRRESKAALFNLEEEEELTHYGQSLSKLDDFDNIGLGLDDEDEGAGQIDSGTVKKVHFGGFESDEDDDDEGVSAMFLRTRVLFLSLWAFPARPEKNKGRSHGRGHRQEQGA